MARRSKSRTRLIYDEKLRSIFCHQPNRFEELELLVVTTTLHSQIYFSLHPRIQFDVFESCDCSGNQYRQISEWRMSSCNLFNFCVTSRSIFKKLYSHTRIGCTCTEPILVPIQKICTPMREVFWALRPLIANH